MITTERTPTAISVLGDKTIRFRIFIILMIFAVAAVELRREVTDGLYVFYHQRLRDPRMIRRYFDAHAIRKLQLGAGGNNAPDWLNSDIEPQGDEIYIDATSHYPFPSESFHYVFAEHLIEHLPWESGLRMLQECFRVLAPGGKIRIITPDLARYLYALNNETDPEVQRFIKANQNVWEWPDTPVGAAYVFNKEVREWGHVFMYDAETLRRTLKLAGFRDIKQLQIGEKTDPVFEKAEYRTKGRFVQEDVWIINKMGAMAFEAVK